VSRCNCSPACRRCADGPCDCTCTAAQLAEYDLWLAGQEAAKARRYRPRDHVDAVRWRGPGDHELVQEYGPGQYYARTARSRLRLDRVRPGDWVVTTPGVARPAVLTDAEFQKRYERVYP
jgi:hypothetical protein